MFLHANKRLKTNVNTAITKTANAQTLHIYHTYRTFLKSSPLHVHEHHEHLGCFMQLYNRMVAYILAFP